MPGLPKTALMDKKKRLLLIYPQMGMSGAYVRHIPLSLLYAAVDSLKAGFEIDIVDTRLCPTSWKEELAAKISPESILAGVSVITGTPIGSALEITRWLKRYHPHMATVWGGPHANFNPEQILTEASVDYVISGSGSKALARLAQHLRDDAEPPQLMEIAGLAWRDHASGKVHAVPPENVFEVLDYRDIPYFLVERLLPQYGQLDGKDRVFSIYSTLGCPYGCSFCSSPAMYRQISPKYLLLPPQAVADHIEYLQEKYQASYIYFIDDDSFVDLGQAEAIIDEIKRRGLRVKLGFRGARIDEILRMDDAYLSKLAQAGTNILHIGAESGSQRMLDLMQKRIKVEDILAVNRKLARHPEITAAYNWMFGLPGETLADLRETRELVLQILDDNPAALVFPPDKYRPLPGTELYERAVAFGYRPPETLEGWIDVEVEGDYKPAWYSPEFSRMVNMMQVAAYFIDNKLFRLSIGDGLRDRLIRMAARLYRPIALLRYRHGISAFLCEYWLYKQFARSFRKTPKD
jgi:radical SAM superfamily enzyme YgiQ (UPF0313 family)